ncbi:hypothetical protein [Burkholderia sp. 572]|uniref:hypothetical protein n=1 Tax=Burkholderia sp. 572 TaxID=3156414 RepID=UPI003394BCE9
MNVTLTDIDVLMLAEKFSTLKGASTTDQIGFARALLATQQPEPRDEVTALIKAAEHVVEADRACALDDSDIDALATAIDAARAGGAS